jgi:DNA (cytosine-5)-methyltransferase 1
MRGLERGVERAFTRLGWKQPTTAAYVEIEAFIIWNLVKQMEQGVLDPAPIHSNIKTFPWEILRGKIDFIFGGYPCQPFSVAGKLGGTEDPRHLWPYIKSGIETIKPVGCFFENVRNHLNIGYEQVKTELEELGYRVEQGIYSAEEVGAPHKRDRLFILAILADTYTNDSGNELGNISSESKEIKREEQRTERNQALWQRGRNESRSCSKQMEHSSFAGLQESGYSNVGEFSEEERKGLDDRPKQSGDELAHSGCIGRWPESHESIEPKFIDKGYVWPSKPGQEQFGWEYPRTESRVGFTVDGYNFREDLLRMAGNGVVEQTAELAFLDLLKKHLWTSN